MDSVDQDETGPVDSDASADERVRSLGEDPVLTLLVRFSAPTLIAMVSLSFSQLAERVIVGRAVGAIGIAGISIGFPVLLLQMAFAALVGIGGAAAISTTLGRRGQAAAERVLGNAVLLLTSGSLLLSAAGLLLLPQLLAVLGATPDSLAVAHQYLRILLLGGVLQGLGLGLHHLVRAEGSPRAAMVIVLVGSGARVVLDLVLVTGLGMGVRGAAVATVLSQLLCAACVLGHFYLGGSILRLRWRCLWPQLVLLKEIVAIGMAPFAMRLGSVVVGAALNVQLSRYGGAAALSVMGMLFSISSMLLVPVMGLSQALQPIIGYNFGAGKLARVRTTLKLGLGAGTLVVVGSLLLIPSLRSSLISLFAPGEPGLVPLGTHAITLFFVALPVLGVQIVGANYFQAVGQGFKSMLLLLCRQLVFQVPALWLLPLLLGLDGVWLASPLADALAAMVTGVFVVRELRRLQERPPVAAQLPLAGQAPSAAR